MILGQREGLPYTIGPNEAICSGFEIVQGALTTLMSGSADRLDPKQGEATRGPSKQPVLGSRVQQLCVFPIELLQGNRIRIEQTSVFRAWSRYRSCLKQAKPRPDLWLRVLKAPRAHQCKFARPYPNFLSLAPKGTHSFPPLLRKG